MTTYLVTGGAGFIGSNFILYLYRKYGDNIRVINLDKLTYAGNPENLKEIEDRENYAFVQGDICDTDCVQDVFKQYEIDRVVHFAAESHVDRSIESSEIFVKTNVLGTQVLLETARNAWKVADNIYKENKKFLHVSTDEVYGALGAEGYFYETTPYDPHSPYSASKASADMLVKAYMDTYAFPANITNCSNNYGPYQYPEKLIPVVMKNALAGKEIPLYGDGKNVRDWLYVEDHARALDMVLEAGKPFERYNVGGNEERENVEIISCILRELKEQMTDDDVRKAGVSEKLIAYVEDRKGHDRRYAISAEKIKKELGWKPEYTFEDGMKKTVRWYLEHEDWMKHIADEKER